MLKMTVLVTIIIPIVMTLYANQNKCYEFHLIQKQDPNLAVFRISPIQSRDLISLMESLVISQLTMLVTLLRVASWP